MAMAEVCRRHGIGSATFCKCGPGTDQPARDSGQAARASIDVFRLILVLKEKIEREALPRFSHRRQDKAQRLLRYLYARPVADVKAMTG